ncbi:FG-GAP-like repeat-containing protein [Paraliomyxa miuraensis]|uniref:FG-GAP-like repeat-containing protein n=1 Tax=Paraliomyxa miuraensis TaxID=376150 RepID=UPI00225AE8AF|nr:FG-GAP-like repeat-containing protein [Paraliomyxa miuraensis]MCX4244513.1 hypothetical protein [Paraliomyxa miuraensis]
MTIDRTTTWALALSLSMLGGCTSNSISLDSDDDGDTEGDTGTETFPGTSTTPPADSGSDDGPPVECVDDSDCGGWCGWCSAGVCQEDVGCCGSSPEDPQQWRCSPPLDCWDDSECGDGEICVGGWCEPDPNPELQEPPACRDDLALWIDELALDGAYQQVAVAGGSPWVIGVGPQLHPVSFETGVGAPVGATLPDDTARELLALDASTLVAMTTGPRGGDHHLSRLHDPGDGAWLVESTELQAAPARAAAWLHTPAEVVVATDGQLVRWTAQLQPIGPVPLLFSPPATLARFPMGDGTSLAALAREDGAVELWDVSADVVTVQGHTLAGSPVDLAPALDTGGGEPRLMAVSHLVIEPQPGLLVDYAAIELVRIDEPLSGTPPFGAPGIPRALATTDLDGNGVYDVLVANDDGRLDLYLMDAEGPRCRSYLPLPAIVDLEVGDIDGDGVDDVLVLDDGPTLRAIHGVGR